MDNGTAAWIVVATALAAFGAVFYWLHGIVSRARMMRCPETGSVTFVRAKAVEEGAGNVCKVTVEQCDLWPGRKECGRGCLGRYWETTSGLRGNLEALRPFEPR